MGDDFQKFYQEILSSEMQRCWPQALREQFELLSCLGRDDEDGGVFLLRRRADGRKAVLRVSRGEERAASRVEFAILSRIRDARVPAVMDLFEEGERCYLIREYLEGRTLGEYCETHGVLPKKEVVDIALQLASILEFLHGQDPPVIHRDIKPANIILNAEGEVRLVDFGIARRFSEGADSDTVAIGTRPYMAPEQFGGAQTDARSDLFSLGVVMLYMMTGSHDRTNVRHRLPYPELTPLVCRSLHVDPERRPQTAQEFRRQLGRAAAGGRRRTLIRLGAAAALLALLLGSAGLGHIYGARASFSEGRSAGLDEGLAAGRKLGYEEGYAMGVADAERLMREGQDALAARLFDTVPALYASGNLGQGGWVAETEGLVCYSDARAIYRWKDGETGPLRLAEEAGDSLNIVGDYLYYRSAAGIRRIPLKGGTVETVVEGLFERLCVGEDRLYFHDRADEGRLYSAALDGSDIRRVSELAPLFYVSVRSGWLYFCRDMSDQRRLPPRVSRLPCRLRLGEPGQPEVLGTYEAHWLNVTEGRIYYISHNNGAKLFCAKADGSETRVLSGIAPISINVSRWGIFYTDSVDKKLYRAGLDGQGIGLVCELPARDINVAGGWVYFRGRDDGALYRVRADGRDLQKIN